MLIIIEQAQAVQLRNLLGLLRCPLLLVLPLGDRRAQRARLGDAPALGRLLVAEGILPLERGRAAAVRGGGGGGAAAAAAAVAAGLAVTAGVVVVVVDAGVRLAGELDERACQGTALVGVGGPGVARLDVVRLGGGGADGRRRGDVLLAQAGGAGAVVRADALVTPQGVGVVGVVAVAVVGLARVLGMLADAEVRTGRLLEGVVQVVQVKLPGEGECCRGGSPGGEGEGGVVVQGEPHGGIYVRGV